jgi:hypothetical protein
MMKIGWLAANPEKRKSGSMVKYDGVEFAISSIDQIHTHKVVKQNGVSIYRKKKILKGE